MEKPRIQVRVETEEIKNKIVERAAELNKTTQQYILDLIDYDMNNKLSHKKIQAELCNINRSLLDINKKLDLK